jgi:hypothetical protein
MGALTGRRGPQGGGPFSPKDGSCACPLGGNLNPKWSYWPRNFQPMYLIDRSSAFQRVLGRYRGLGTNQQTSLLCASFLNSRRASRALACIATLTAIWQKKIYIFGIAPQATATQQVQGKGAPRTCQKRTGRNLASERQQAPTRKRAPAAAPPPAETQPPRGGLKEPASPAQATPSPSVRQGWGAGTATHDAGGLPHGSSYFLGQLWLRPRGPEEAQGAARQRRCPVKYKPPVQRFLETRRTPIASQNAVDHEAFAAPLLRLSRRSPSPGSLC